MCARRKYNAFGRTYLFDLDFYYLRGGTDEKDWDVKYVVDAYHSGNVSLRILPLG
jgi:[histone H3]-lysine9 N-trimethyltransferase SUV39H